MAQKRPVGAPAVRHYGRRIAPFSDLYFHLMNGSWGLILLFITLAYLAVNTIFALLYMAGGDSVAGIEGGVFSDYFFFSVQTLSTIGYGAYAPKTDYGEMVMTSEAIAGLLCTALATGLVFSKFARPNAKFLFARNLVVTKFDGVPTLMMRLANGRANEVVDASIRVAILKPEVSSEGHSMARLHTLKLVRKRSPVFALSWTVMHLITEDSPLYGIDAASMEEFSIMPRIIVTITGIDGTFAQSVHGRYTYQGDEILWDTRFVDAIEVEEDGTPAFDHAKLHLTEPEA